MFKLLGFLVLCSYESYLCGIHVKNKLPEEFRIDMW